MDKIKIEKTDVTESEFLSSIYLKHFKMIYNMAFRMTGNIEDSEDIAQETFIRAFRNISDFKGDSKILIKKNDTFYVKFP